MFIRLVGKHFLLQPAWQQMTLNDEKVNITYVEILSDETAIAWVRLSHPLSAGIHQIKYRSPYGISTTQLEVL